jgi:hypothetical protein
MFTWEKYFIDFMSNHVPTSKEFYKGPCLNPVVQDHVIHALSSTQSNPFFDVKVLDFSLVHYAHFFVNL